MSIISQLEFQLDFSQSEKALAQYILDNGSEVLNMNTKELSKITYTSPATIVRLCQKLGLKGYNDFKIKYSAELKTNYGADKRINMNLPFNTDDDFESVCSNIQNLYSQAIEDTRRLINSSEFEDIIELLYNGKSIYLFGYGDSVLAAMDFENKMSKIRKNINLRIIPGEQFALACNADKNDAAILISYTGETHGIVHIAEILKENQVPIIAMTSVGDNRLTKYADYIVHICSRERIVHKIAPFSSKLSTQFLLDIIFCRIFQKDYDKNLNFKINLGKRFDKRHPNSPIDK